MAKNWSETVFYYKEHDGKKISGQLIFLLIFGPDDFLSRLSDIDKFENHLERVGNY